MSVETENKNKNKQNNKQNKNPSNQTKKNTHTQTKQRTKKDNLCQKGKCQQNIPLNFHSWSLGEWQGLRIISLSFWFCFQGVMQNQAESNMVE